MSGAPGGGPMAANGPGPVAGAWRKGLARLAALPRSRRIAAAASAAWVVVVAAYAIGFFGASQSRGTTFVDGAFFLVTLALPLILVWLAAFLAEELDRQREMIAALGDLVGPLIGSLEGARSSIDRHGPASPADIARAVQSALAAGRGTDATAATLDRVLAGQAHLASRLDALLERGDAPAATPPPAPAAVAPPAQRAADRAPVASAQPDLPLPPGPDPETPLDWDDLIRAVDFPRDEGDADGFRSLRRALRTPQLAQMLQAAEDVMTLLSQDGVYMDDLAVAPGDPQAWRRLAAGERGETVAALGGVIDAAAVASAQALSTADTIFRDTALVFQRRLEGVLGERAASASDAELARFADTRSGRAYQLLARASGSPRQTDPV